MPMLFTYGTLQDPNVQRRVLGRLVTARPCVLTSFKSVSAGRFFNAVPEPGATLAGTFLEITEEELLVIDAYEAGDRYRRTAVTLESGASAWMYVTGG